MYYSHVCNVIYLCTYNYVHAHKVLYAYMHECMYVRSYVALTIYSVMIAAIQLAT